MQKNKKIGASRKFYSALGGVSFAACGLTLAALCAVVLFVLIRGTGSLSFHLLFGEFSSDHPSIFPAFMGTLQLILISILIAVPLGVATAIFLTEYMQGEGKIVKIIRISVESLAGIPSIVYGLFGYLVFAVTLGWGYTMLGGGITLAIMILPTVVRNTEESLRAVPLGYREGSFALGAGKVRTIFAVVLPAASGGIVTAVILAVGRVVSESAVLILTIGMVVGNLSLGLTGPGTSLALDVYYFANFGYPKEAAATAVVLLLLVLGINLTAAFVGKMIRKKYGEIT